MNYGTLRAMLFTACASEFQHPVLNSYLHELPDVASLIEYYETPVESPDALDRLEETNQGELPSNLRIQSDPVRFHPSETTFFQRTAFPGRSTVVSGLATARRYKGFRAPQTRRTRVEHGDRI